MDAQRATSECLLSFLLLRALLAATLLQGNVSFCLPAVPSSESVSHHPPTVPSTDGYLCLSVGSLLQGTVAPGTAGCPVHSWLHGARGGRREGQQHLLQPHLLSAGPLMVGFMPLPKAKVALGGQIQKHSLALCPWWLQCNTTTLHGSREKGSSVGMWSPGWKKRGTQLCPPSPKPSTCTSKRFWRVSAGYLSLSGQSTQVWRGLAACCSPGVKLKL